MIVVTITPIVGRCTATGSMYHGYRGSSGATIIGTSSSFSTVQQIHTFKLLQQQSTRNFVAFNNHWTRFPPSIKSSASAWDCNPSNVLQQPLSHRTFCSTTATTPPTLSTTSKQSRHAVSTSSSPTTTETTISSPTATTTTTATTPTTSAPPLHVCIVGSGPAGFYSADSLLKSYPNAYIDIYEKLPTPYGLVR